MGRPLPFDAFLDALRAQGYSVGLHEHMALARLLARWDGTDPQELGASIAALVSRSEQEVTTVRVLFDEVYLPRPAPPPPPPPPPLVPWWRHPVAWVGVAGAVLAVALVAGYYVRPPEPPRPDEAATAPSPEPQPPPPAPAPPPEVPVEAPPPTPPPLPEPAAPTAAGAVLQAGAAVFLAGLALTWAQKRRALTRQWLRDAWRTSLGALPGPYRFDLHIRAIEARLPRTAVEDAATMLGRIYSPNERTRTLDPTESLRLTLRNGLLPSLVFRRVRTARPIVVLQDVGLDMRLWRQKVEGLLADLRRQGVALERWYFDGHPGRLSDRPHGPPKPIAQVVGLRPDAPVLVLSAGGGLAALADDLEWRRVLGRSERRAWITPVGDARLWPGLLREAPVEAWPMTRDGLTSAARALAGFETAETVRVHVLADQRVAWDDIERVKRLASLVPHPTPELLEFLRQRFAPDIPDAAVAHVSLATGADGREARLDEADIQRLALAVRTETPTLEAAVRGEILARLRDSEPAPGSAAHLRWQMAVALQEIPLAALRGGDASPHVAALQQLRSGPLWEEVDRAATLVPGVAAAGVTPGASTAGASHPPTDARVLGWAPRPRSAPGLRELVLASSAAVVVLAAAWGAGAFPTTALARVENAYELAPATGEPLRLNLRPVDNSAPLVANLFQDGALYQRVTVNADRSAVAVDIAGGAGHTYQAQAQRQDGDLALSNPLWVPDADRVVVLVDAHPWARVVVEGNGQRLEAGATPVRVALRPGPYQLRLENGGVTPPLDQPITVAPNDPAQQFTFQMPGFDPNAAANPAANGAAAQ